MNELSKYLCLLLRHQPEKAGLDMDKHGWVSAEQLIVGRQQSVIALDETLTEYLWLYVFILPDLWFSG